MRSRGPAWAFVGLEIEWEALERLYAEVGLPPRLPGAAWRVSVPVFVDGANLSFSEVLAWNGYMDLPQSWWPSHAAAQQPHGAPKLWRGRRGHHCSAFTATGNATRDGRIVMAHNSWDRYAAGDAFNVGFDIVPDRGNRILMQGLPGCISSRSQAMVLPSSRAGVPVFSRPIWKPWP